MRRFPAVPGIQPTVSRKKVSRQLGDPNLANRPGTDEKGCKNAGSPQAANSQLVSDQRRAFQWRARGHEFQGKTHYEKSQVSLEIFQTKKCCGFYRGISSSWRLRCHENNKFFSRNFYASPCKQEILIASRAKLYLDEKAYFC